MIESKHHCDFHVHFAKEDNIKKGFKPEKYAEITKEFSTFQDALKYFFDACNVVGAEQYFSFFNN